MTDQMSGLIISGAHYITLFIICVGLFQNVIYFAQLILSGHELSSNPPVRRAALLWKRYADLAPPIAILSPAFNEELTIIESVRSMLSLEYPSFEIIVINDGSSDRTLERLKEAFDLVPTHRAFSQATEHAPIRCIYKSTHQSRLIVIDKENGGKSDALNAGINVSRAPIFCSMDADSILEPDALLRAVGPFVDDPTRVIAVGGTVRLANGCKIENGRLVEVGIPRNPLALLQVVEYLRAFLMARLAWSKLGAITIISGTFGLFKRRSVITVGGYSKNTVGEDMELVIKLHRHFQNEGKPYRIAYVPEPVCWTEAPESLKVLSRQRSRWHRGSLETFFQHKDMFLNPKYGRVGVLGFGNIFFVDILGPFAEILGYILIPLLYFAGLLSHEYLFAFLAVSFTFGVAVSVGSLALEEIELKRIPRTRDLILLTIMAILENFGYRQLSNVWRMMGTLQFIRRKKGWGEMTRVGFGGSPVTRKD